MKSYPINDSSEAIHTVCVTFQIDEYRGYAYYKIGGSTKGWQVIGSYDLVEVLSEAADTGNLEFEQMKLVLNDETFDIELTDKDGNSCQYADEIDWLDKLIVAVEIVKYE
ncbi:DUF5406 family protein [Latilactobacillus fragifolii]|uniref:DUF5406 family protein n=1 Tax=Latilactobacillus fragifolii TaxID=2814244 RepID=UPI001ABB9FD0|nr:DUF5406 family protein [Latilactobacillus fragifolii]